MRPRQLPHLLVTVTCAVAALAALPAAAGSLSLAARPIVVSADLSSRFSGEVYRVDLSGRRVDLSRSPAQDTSPVVSPNGREVAFLSDRTGQAALYEVGIDGGAIARISAALPTASQPFIVGWLPDNRHVLVVTERLTDSKPPLAWTLALVSYAPSERPRVLATDGSLNGIVGPAVSPDGRFVAYRGVFDMRVVATDGSSGFTFARNWSGSGQVRLVWSARNRLAALFDRAVHVYDERGRLLARYPANDFAWSSRGGLLAVMSGGILAVRDGGGAGRVVLDERLFPASLIQQIVKQFGQNAPQLAWRGESKVLVANVELGTQIGSSGPSSSATANVSVAVPGGKMSKPSEQAWIAATCGCVSPDGTLLAQTPNFGTNLTIQVSSPSGANARTVEHVPGCWDDGVYTADVGYGQIEWAAGRSLVYASRCTTPPADLYTVDANGALHALTHNVKLTATDPALSPDGTRIAFSQADAPNSCRGCTATVWTMNIDGSAPHALTEPPDANDDTWDRSPSWSPDGTQIVYSHSTIDSFGVLYLVDADTGAATSLHVAGASPAWGPTRIAYLGNTNLGGTHITLRTIAPDGTAAQTLATGALASPAWSRNGRLAALDLSGKTPQAVEVTDGRTTRVALPLADAAALLWSADGTRLLVVGRRLHAGPYDLYSLKPDGTDERRLTLNLDVLDAAS